MHHQFLCDECMEALEDSCECCALTLCEWCHIDHQEFEHPKDLVHPWDKEGEDE